MARPAFVFCDTDATLQFLLVRQIRPLQVLHARYAIQPLVVQEVELELISHKKFGRRIGPELKKALANGVVKVLNKAILESYYGGTPASSPAADNALAEIGKLGKEFDKFVGPGEAFTFAAANTLRMPALSNDLSALATLQRTGYAVPAPVLRAFDLICLSYQTKEMNEAECDAFRSALATEKEHLPVCFRNASFASGLANFTPRITDFKAPDVGKRNPLASGFESVLVL